MSPSSPFDAAHTHGSTLGSRLPSRVARASTPRWTLGLCALLAACSATGTATQEQTDGSFGTGAGQFSRDGGIDSGLSAQDASSASGPSVRVRFMNAIPNTGALVVCHDPDGAGPMSAYVLREDTAVLRAEYGMRSDSLVLPALSTGELTLQREPSRASADAGVDAGASSDAGAARDLCDASLREATIPLPITGAWLMPGSAVTDERFAQLDLLPALAGASAVTLFGSGLSLNDSALDLRQSSARDRWLQAHPGDTAQADVAAKLERSALVAMFGARALLQPDRPASNLQDFTLSVFHGIPDVAPGDSTLADREVGAVRLCINAASRELGVVPKPPAAGIPFRVRTQVGESFEARLSYDFRVFAAAAFDAKNQDCSTTSLAPLAKATFANFEAGHTYTLALLGAVAPVSLCGVSDGSIVRASCALPTNQLGARIALLVD